jgi:hypothetical protein
MLCCPSYNYSALLQLFFFTTNAHENFCNCFLLLQLPFLIWINKLYISKINASIYVLSFVLQLLCAFTTIFFL